jgi:hypothetical protein
LFNKAGDRVLIHSEVKAIRESEQGTELIIKVDDRISDKILRYREGGKVLAEIRINDGRCITNEQRKKFYATVRDIADHIGETIDYIKDYFKALYCFYNKIESISLSDCSITDGRELINIAIEFAIRNDIPLMDLALNRTDDIDRLLYVCLIYRKCCVCGRPADIHHIDTIGMGSDRKDDIHVGKRVIALCREHHNLAHSMGKNSFEEKYKVYGIKLDKFLIEKLRL